MKQKFSQTSKLMEKKTVISRLKISKLVTLASGSEPPLGRVRFVFQKPPKPPIVILSMIELHKNDENRRRADDPGENPCPEDGFPDAEDDELGFFGIVPPKKRPDSPHPYDKDGNYVPRNLRK